jgi:AraC-like DNA-binding protein
MLYLSGVIIAFFLAVLLFTKKQKSAGDYILSAWLVVLGFHLLTFYLKFTGQELTLPALVTLGVPLPLAHGPFLYLYTYQQTSSRRLRLWQWLHFVPLLFMYVLFARFYTLSHEEQVAVWLSGGKGFETPLMINLYAIYLSGIIYITLSLIRLFNYRRRIVHQFSNTEKINFNWLLYLIIWLVVIWTAVLVLQEDELIFGAASLFVLWLGYFGIRQVQVFTHHPHSSDKPGAPVQTPSQSNAVADTDDESVASIGKYQKSSLTEEDAQLIHNQLKQLLQTAKPYTNPDLTLDELAEQLEVHPNHLSQVINAREGKSFYDLVNEKRVQAFIEATSKPGNEQYTLLALALDCGFNSKASFNRNFKKYTGQTPTDYLKMPIAS